MRIKPILLALLALIFFVGVDVLIWGMLFEHGAPLRDHTWVVGIYHRGLLTVLIGEMAIGALALLPDWRAAAVYAVTLGLFASCGTQDILYYLALGIPIPAVMPWAEWNPLIIGRPITRESIAISSLVWVCLWSGGLLLVRPSVIKYSH